MTADALLVCLELVLKLGAVLAGAAALTLLHDRTIGRR